MGYALLIKSILILKQTSLSSPVDDFSYFNHKKGCSLEEDAISRLVGQKGKVAGTGDGEF